MPSKSSLTRAGILFAGLVALLSCQDIYQENDPTKIWSLSTSPDSVELPDSVHWRGPWESGGARVVRESTQGRLELDLRHAPDLDTLELNWFQMGVRRKTTWCVASDDSRRLKVVREARDSLGATLLDAFWKGRGSLPANLEPATAQGLRRFLAGRILLGDSLFRPFPARIPLSMVADTVRLDVWAAACRSGWPMFRVLATWGLATDSVEFRRGVESLLRSGRIASSDTSMLFGYPVHLRKDLVQPDVKQGDSARPAGVFAWAAGLSMQVQASLRLRNLASDSISVDVVAPPGAADTTWDATKGLIVRVGENAATGLDTLLVRLKDRAGRYEILSRAAFGILAKPRDRPLRDTIAPRIAHRAVADSVDWSTRSVTVEWQFKDQGPNDSVWIGGEVLALDPTGFYRRDLPLTVGANVVVFRARDSAGNPAVDSIRVVRRKDQQPPEIQRTSEVASWSVPFDSTQATVRWTVTDNRGVSSCRIDSLEAIEVAGDGLWSCRARLSLPLGTRIVALRVQDSSGNSAYDTIRIERLAETTPPTAKALAGQGSREVSFDTTSAWVGWEVADLHGLASCLIDGQERLQATSGGKWMCRAGISLVVGRNVARMEVRDSSGNTFQDSVVVVRGKDLVAPTSRPLGGAARLVVPFDSLQMTVGWEVADNHSLVACRIDGVESARLQGPGVWNCTVKKRLLLGETKIALEARDSSGNSTLDTLTVVRETDHEPPRLVEAPGMGSRDVEFDSLRVAIGWKVGDNDKVAWCRIEGRLVAPSAGGICSLAVEPPVGSAIYRIEAADASGNIAKDSLMVGRMADTVAPRLVALVDDTIRVDTNLSSLTIKWVMTDNQGIRYVALNSWDRTFSGDTFELVIKPRAGIAPYSLSVVDSAGNTTKNLVVVLRDAQAPRHRTDSVYYGGEVPDTLDVPGGTDSIEISRDRITWKRVGGVAMLDAAGTWYARAWPGKTESSVFLRQAPLTENVFAGASTSFFLRSDSLFATGRNEVGQLGTGTRAVRVLSPVFVRKGVKKVVAGEDFSLMLLTNGEVVGAGTGPLSRLTAASSLGADLWLVARGIVDIAAGRDFFLVLDKPGKVRAVGANDKGQLGTGDSAVRTSLTEVATRTAAIATGWSHSIRLDSTGKVWAVGASASGQLGKSTTRDASGWRLVDSLADAVYSSLGEITLFRGQDRRIRGLGANDQGQLSGSLGPIVSSPTVLYDLDGAWAGGGTSHVLVLLEDNDLKVAGSNQSGQIGLGSDAGSVGFQWQSGGNAKAAVGRDHSLVVKSTGEPLGMGANTDGELGQGAVGPVRLPRRIWY